MRRNNILAISISCLFLFSGCAASNQELVDEALLTGDWTNANKRFAALERLEARRPRSCSGGLTSFCVKRHTEQRCRCVSGSEGREMFRDMYDGLNR